MQNDIPQISAYYKAYYNWCMKNPCNNCSKFLCTPLKTCWDDCRDDGCTDLFYCCFGGCLSSLARAIGWNNLAKKIESKTPRAGNFLI